jgi:hypothetical protein
VRVNGLNSTPQQWEMNGPTQCVAKRCKELASQVYDLALPAALLKERQQVQQLALICSQSSQPRANAAGKCGG